MIAAVTPTATGGSLSSFFKRNHSEETVAFAVRWRQAKPIRERHWTDEDFEAEAERLDREIAEYIAAHGLYPRDDASKNGVFRSSELAPEFKIRPTPKIDISTLH